MEELLLINYIINSQSWQIIIDNNIDSSYFISKSAEFKYLQEYVNIYNKVPSREVFLITFSDFEIYDTSDYSPESLIDNIKRKKLQSKTIELYNEVRDFVNKEDANPIFLNEYYDKLSSFAKSFNDIVTDSYPLKAIGSKDIADLLKEKFIARNLHKDEFVYKTGFPWFDEVFNGWDKDNDYVVISGRPGTGKSMMLCLLAAEQLRAGKKVVFYEGEMDVSQTMERIIAHLSCLSETDMLLGKAEIQQEYFKQIDKWLSGDNFYIITPQMLGGKYANVHTLESICKKVGAEILFIDQQSLMEDEDHAKQFFEKASNISRQIKGMRDRLNIPVLTAVQQNRQKLEGGEVDTVQIAGSDTIVQDASKVIMISRDINKTVDEDLEVKITITKNRNGRLGKKQFVTDFSKCKFIDKDNPQTEEDKQLVEESNNGYDSAEAPF